MKLSNKMRLDVETMRYFYPGKSGGRSHITKQDIHDMAVYSATGKKPGTESKGFKQLVWGKTYRDLQITQWREDIRDGFITKWEVQASVPVRLREWVIKKIADVPYDTNGETSKMILSLYRKETS